MLSEFKAFAMKGNVVDLAIGVVIGAAFVKIVSSLIEDVITPLILKPALEAAKLSEIEQLDGPAKETLQKVLDYVEKKYMAVPMKMAKEILIQN